MISRITKYNLISILNSDEYNDPCFFLSVGACFNHIYIFVLFFSSIQMYDILEKIKNKMMNLPTIHLGQTAVKITRIGLGAMPLSVYGRPTKEDAIKVIHRTIDLGITLIDTADAYCLDENDKNHGEILLHQAFQTYQGSFDVNQIIVATKGFVTSRFCYFYFLYFRWSDSSRWCMGNRFKSHSSSSSNTSKL